MKKGNNVYILMIISFVLLIILGISIGYNVFQDNNKNYKGDKDLELATNQNELDEPILGAHVCTDNNQGGNTEGIGCCCGVSPKPTTTTTKAPGTTKKTTQKTTEACVEKGYSIYSIAADDQACVGEQKKFKCNRTIIYQCSGDVVDFSTDENIDTSTEGQVTLTCGNASKIINIKNCNPEACYRKYSGNGTYDYKWTSDPQSGYNKVDNITKKSDCEMNSPSICNASLVSQPKSVNAPTCSGTATLDLSQDTQCNSVAATSFYRINCDEIVKAEFKPGNMNIRVGQGFKYNINVTSNNVCTAIFDASAWNDAYNNINKLINRAKLAGDATEENWYKAIRNQIVDTANAYISLNESYKKWNDANDNNNPTATLSISYKVNNTSKVLNSSFIFDSKSGDVNYKQNGIQTLANGLKVENFISEKKSSVTLTPPKVYINNSTGNIVSSSSNATSAGNYFLTDLKSDTGKYKMSITISNLGASKNSTITNDNCELGISDNDIVYRIIDVRNPFNVASVVPGINWSNDKYNFEKTIKGNTWSLDSLYEFNLTPNEISDIKSSNARYSGSNAYLGVCNDSPTTQDEITKKICEIIKK